MARIRSPLFASAYPLPRFAAVFRPAMTAASTHACPRRLPRIALLATGGTIAGAGPDSTATTYVAGALRGQALLQAVPQLAQLAQVQVHELFALDSADISDAQRLQLAQRVAALARQGDVDGIVITHGTDTLEESAYLLHLTLKTAKPVVLTGTMRAATALGANEPLNLYQATAKIGRASCRERV